MALVYLFFAIGFVSAPEPHPHVDCNHDPQHCIQVALVTTDPKECEHIIHYLQDCHSYVIDHVCGTDQRTYPHKCELAKARCHTLNLDHGVHVLALAHEGSCSSTTQIHVLAAITHHCHNDPVSCIELAIHTVDSTFCREFINTVDCTHIHSGGGSHADRTQPVCGTDGVSYPHHCEFARERCRVILQTNNNVNGQQVFKLDIAHDGICNLVTVAPISNCANNSCLDPSLSGPVVQQCLQILKLSCTTGSAVCGTDGQTYRNDCDLAKAHCLNVNLTKAYDGTCGVSTQQTSQTTQASTNAASTSSSSAPTTPPPPTTSTLPPTTTMSVTDILVTVFCQNVDSISCNTGFNVICGSDGTYYPNECELSKESCKQKGLHIMPDASSCTVPSG
ncbi:agrin-like isoform X3 [Dreissena polymorpha]|uniref:agrin-like isoform X3 n=1 Tax=Dreissena polymorpha TaxID=45954 RepID=UPI0022644EBC|nr:agrin-like isoform X3 [Dreissena polymorpha]